MARVRVVDASGVLSWTTTDLLAYWIAKGGYAEYVPGEPLPAPAPDPVTQPVDLLGRRIVNLADPTTPDGAATRRFVEEYTAPVLVLGPGEDPPPGTAAGTVIVRRTA